MSWKRVRRDQPLSPVDIRFVRLLDRMIQTLGRGPTVSEIEEEWNGSRSGIVERAHALRELGMLSFPLRS